MSSVPVAVLAGSRLWPVVELAAPPDAVHVVTGERLSVWLQPAIPEADRQWDAARKTWVLSRVGDGVQTELEQAGIAVVGSDGQPVDLDDYRSGLALNKDALQMLWLEVQIESSDALVVRRQGAVEALVAIPDLAGDEQLVTGDAAFGDRLPTPRSLPYTAAVSTLR